MRVFIVRSSLHRHSFPNHSMGLTHTNLSSFFVLTLQWDFRGRPPPRWFITLFWGARCMPWKRGNIPRFCAILLPLQRERQRRPFMNWKRVDFEPSSRMPFGRVTGEVLKWEGKVPMSDQDAFTRTNLLWCTIMWKHLVEKCLVIPLSRLRISMRRESQKRKCCIMDLKKKRPDRSNSIFNHN